MEKMEKLLVSTKRLYKRAMILVLADYKFNSIQQGGINNGRQGKQSESGNEKETRES